jgi:cytochrome P450
MHAYGKTMIEMTHDSIDGWPVGKRFPLHERTQSITMQVILRTVFGIEEGPRFTELARLLKQGLDLAAWPGLLFPIMQKDFGRFSPWGRWLRIREKTSALLRAEIRNRRMQSNEGRTDVLAMMIAARDEAGQPLSEDEIHDELVTLLVAGHETTATALAWAMRWLLVDRALVERLRAEIATANGDPAKLAKLELLDGTVKETLRMQPVVPLVGRLLKQPRTIAGWELPAGTLIAPAIPLVHRDPSLYPNPDKFDPDRFRDFKPAAWEFLPFGGGLRRCVGAAFAVYEMKMVLAAILPRVDMALFRHDIRIVRRSITLTPSHGLPVVVTKKRPRTGDRVQATGDSRRDATGASFVN